MEEKDQLREFLVKHKAFRKFCRNLEEDRDMTYKEYISYEHEGSLIGGAFTWRSTPEGVEYWSDLSSKFRSGVY